ncbi:hypothetical protein ES703_72393 [subsurface metagenome]
MRRPEPRRRCRRQGCPPHLRCLPSPRAGCSGQMRLSLWQMVDQVHHRRQRQDTAPRRTSARWQWRECCQPQLLPCPGQGHRSWRRRRVCSKPCRVHLYQQWPPGLGRQGRRLPGYLQKRCPRLHAQVLLNSICRRYRLNSTDIVYP